MRRLTTLIACLAIPLCAVAAPSEKAETATGKALHEKHCHGCHIAKFGGDGNKVYTRKDRKIKTAEQLSKRIAMCNKNTGSNLFPDEEGHIAAYLNGQFYKFR